MRRTPDKPIYKNYVICETFPRFKWTKCNKCGDEFKKESMWIVYLTGACQWGNFDYKFASNKTKIFCKHCYTENELIDLCEMMTRNDD